MIVYNNQQQLTGHCSFQEYSVLLQSPPRNNGNQGQHAIIVNKKKNIRHSQQIDFIIKLRASQSIVACFRLSNQAVFDVTFQSLLADDNSMIVLTFVLGFLAIIKRWKGLSVFYDNVWYLNGFPVVLSAQE